MSAEDNRVNRKAADERPENIAARKLALNGLSLASAALPHLSGLAHFVRVEVDNRFPTAAIAASGRLVVNAKWFSKLSMKDAMFVMAHELMHLCLATHERAVGTEMKIFNIAHDYIINDILAVELQMPVPAGALVHRNARNYSAEKIVTMLRSGKIGKKDPPPQSAMLAALAGAGLTDEPESDFDHLNDGMGCGDVLSEEQEKELFPDDDCGDLLRKRERTRNLAAKSISLKALKEKMDVLERSSIPGVGSGGYDATTEAVRANYAPPWELALQTWMESVMPGPCSYARPSRRGEGQGGAILPGRKREGWTLHIVLDTSGSMTSDLPRILGLIAAFCENNHVALVHILQCDTDVSRDEFVAPEELYNYTLSGFGGSDMSPAMLRLAEDSEVQAVLVLTDGCISWPRTPPEYQVLWGIIGQYSRTDFGYGTVIKID